METLRSPLLLSAEGAEFGPGVLSTVVCSPRRTVGPEGALVLAATPVQINELR